MVVILAVGAADQCGAASGDGFDFIAALLNIRHDLGGGQAVVMIVVSGMAHDLVACVMQRLHRFRILIHPVAHHEEGGLDVVLRQNFDKVLRILIAPRRCKSAAVHGELPHSLLCFYDSINASYLQQNLVQKRENFLIGDYG